MAGNRKTHRTLLVPVCLAAGIAAGILLGELIPGGNDNVAAAPAADDPAADSSIPPSITTDLGLSEAALLYRRAGVADAEALGELRQRVQTRFDGVGRLQAMTILYARQAELDPLAAYDHALAHGSAAGYPWSVAWLDTIFREWARQDLAEAIAFAGRSPHQEIAAAAILAARPDLPAAERAAIVRRLVFRSRELPTAALIAAVVDDPQAVLATHEPSMLDARRAAALVWTVRDPRAALTAMGSRPDSSSARLASDMMALWARRAPGDAVDWALNRDEGEARRRLLSAALAGVASRSPEQAATMAAGLGDEAARGDALSSVLATWVVQDPSAAIGWLDSVSGAAAREQAVRAISMQYGRSDPGAAYEWARSLPLNESDIALPGILFWMAHKESPEVAVQRLREIADASRRLFAAVRVVSEWAKTAPQDAYQWAQERPDDAMRSRLIDIVTFAWGMTDLAGLSERVNSIEGLAEYEQVLRTAWRFLEVDDLERAYERVADPALKSEIAQQIHRRLEWTDPERAEAFRVTAGLGGEPPGANGP